jgi:hypothetical protein
MHDQKLAGLKRDLDVLEEHNPREYHRIQEQVDVVSETADLAVHRTLRARVRRVS